MTMAANASPNTPAPSTRAFSPRRWIAGASLFLVVAAVYWNSLAAPFLFDDVPAVVANPTIRDLASFDVLRPPEHGGTTTGRPIVNLSFALDHALHRDSPGGYRATNVLLHALAALALMGVIGRALRGPVLGSRFGAHASVVSWSAALLWAVHPLQTESVVCIAQRTEVLCGLFLLVVLYCWARATATHATRSRAWFCAAFVASLVGMATKEVMVVAPVLVLLYDRSFFSGTFAATWARRRVPLLALAATWGVLAFLLVRGSGARGASAGFGLGVSPWHYLLTQCEALVLYLRLSLWPHPLVLDYGTSLVRSMAEVWWQGPLVLLALGATVWALVRRPVAGFLGACFFIVLAPSSSFVPLVTQTIAEHRMYLPLAAVVVPVVWGLYRLAGVRLPWAAAALAVALGATTVARNHDFRDALSIWTDTVEKRPTSARAHNNLALVLDEAGRAEEAAIHFARALALDDAYVTAHYNWGSSLLAQGRLEEAVERLETALRLAPEHPDAHVNLGNALVRLGRPADAIRHYERALELEPLADVLYNLGVVHLELGQARPAAARLQSFLRSHPEHPEATYRLGRALEQLSRSDEAVRLYAQVLQVDPRHLEAHRRAGLLRAREGRFEEAGSHFRAVLELEPDDVDAMANLANVHLVLGRAREAVALYEEVLRRRPDDAQTMQNLRLAREALR
ncbi:hypothetical protein ASA1KI_13200 [Opitutales bacterium ASA1]|uniref:tetratricopeptide repeat protein n=1 Tax=Congregicoccus parvus TaxID=3081749 RepID=UPI002B30322C|nr:hypothetical protein ASA1KI_13200 [Opitutales bacterium ASA1]